MVQGTARHVGPGQVPEPAARLRVAVAVFLRSPAQRVEDGQRLALGVIGGAGRVPGAAAVVGDGQAGASERVQVGDGGCRGRRGRLARRILLGRLVLRRRAVGAADAELVPGREGPGAEQPPEVAAHVGVGARIGDQHGVVAVPALLGPRAEHRLVPAVVGMQRRHHAAGRVVAQDGADPGLRGELEAVRRREERLVLPDRPSLVVEDRPAGPGPARRDLRSALGDRARRHLGLVLDLPAEAVGVAEVVLVPGGLRGAGIRRRCRQVGDVRLPGQGVDGGRRGLRGGAGPLVGAEVVEVAGGGVAQDRGRVGQRVGELRDQRRVVQVGGEAGQQVPERLGGLAHHGGGGDHARARRRRPIPGCRWDR